ncbi:CmpA/NrtA family ABC transporter substrate-binding protein [Puniceibacterium sp. IMCC21224]|uniref:CmpA/NrtA family ABC transporter substrate-binding protein n=1 Tax=Puniceibacterium sp. IMCC21224 TaxID=1618204 RepID=UPI00064D9EE9|nr:CmpA/NrtA family ABC transporter substrate-binding protein [Puniceibacterium sp. IMCC21224]KMK68005.1 ABC-type nitrate/sulfonate/bicarbonate transport system, periplasmic component [Puniceibacterium sp. IMCC21224]
MSTIEINAGFIPLVDAAPLIIAREMGFAEEEGLSLILHSAPSWSTLRDRLVVGQIQAAHMLAPVPVAMALGLGGIADRIDVLQVTSVNGSVVGVSTAVAQELRAKANMPGFLDARAAGQALISLGRPLRIGVPFPFSMHAELLYYWLGALGLSVPQSLDVRTVPPQLMADAISADEIDAFCVGEPWGSIAVENGVGELLLPTCTIRSSAPEKVLAMRHDYAQTQPDETGRLMRAVWRACRWLAQPANRITTAEILQRPAYLGVPSEIIDRALSGQLVTTSNGHEQRVDGFLEFFAGAATFPWKSQGAWIAAQLAARVGLDRDTAMTAAKAIFRTDLYRDHLASTTAEMPGASEKLEGALSVPTAVASESGQLTLAPDRFFDGRIFDPSAKN